MQKRLFIFFILLEIILANSVTTNAEVKKPIEIVCFEVETCTECNAVAKYLDVLLEDLKKQGVNVTLTKYNKYKNIDAEMKYQSYARAYKVPPEKKDLVPTVFIGDKCFVKSKEIEANLKNEIMAYHQGKKEYKPIDIKPVTRQQANTEKKNAVNAFHPIAIISAGLLDGFNPCAVAMLLFFISFLMLSDRKGREILLVGILYVSGTFLAYLGIGVGLLNFAFIFKDVKPVIIGIYSITIIMSAILAVLNVRDFFRVRSGNLKDVKTQLPKALRHKIQNFIRNHSVTRFIYLSAFVSGFIVSFLEFFCTGQIYLPTITYVISTGDSILKAIMYLVLYNIAFVLPLLVICILVYKGKQIMDISHVLVDKLHIIKLAVAVFFTFIAGMMVYKLLEIL